MKISYSDLYEMISSLPENSLITIYEEYPGVARQRFQVGSSIGDYRVEYVEENYPFEFFRTQGALVEEILAYRDDVEIRNQHLDG